MCKSFINFNHDGRKLINFFDQNLISPKFGKVVALTKENFLDNIDKEDPSVKIVVHLYEDVSTLVLMLFVFLGNNCYF